MSVSSFDPRAGPLSACLSHSPSAPLLLLPQVLTPHGQRLGTVDTPGRRSQAISGEGKPVDTCSLRSTVGPDRQVHAFACTPLIGLRQTGNEPDSCGPAMHSPFTSESSQTAPYPCRCTTRKPTPNSASSWARNSIGLCYSSRRRDAEEEQYDRDELVRNDCHEPPTGRQVSPLWSDLHSY